ncbi:MAG: NfeD family protein [Cellulomonadaceae bacterium]
MDWYWWLAIMLVLIAVEALTLDLVLFMFAGGALGASMASLLGANLPVQMIAFAVVSTVLLAALRPWLLRNLRKREHLPETNIAAQIGQTAVVLREVSERGGLVKLRGEVWTARSAHGEVFPVDAEVRVGTIDGATAVVEPLTTPHSI